MITVAFGEIHIESLPIGLEYRARLPVTIKKYLNVKIYYSL